MAWKLVANAEFFMSFAAFLAAWVLIGGMWLGGWGVWALQSMLAIFAAALLLGIVVSFREGWRKGRELWNLEPMPNYRLRGTGVRLGAYYYRSGSALLQFVSIVLVGLAFSVPLLEWPSGVAMTLVLASQLLFKKTASMNAC